jgi:hypothetical protein
MPLPDTRVPERCTDTTCFMAWWGLALYLFQLSARRQLDFELRDGGAAARANLNRLAETNQATLPVHDTLGHVALSGWQRLRRLLVQRLLRMKALDAAGSAGRCAEDVKQDCELRAMRRLLPRIKQEYPQRRFVLSVDSLHACGTTFALRAQLDWSCIATFKEGRTPALWREYEALRAQCPQQVVRRQRDQRVQEFRWVNQLVHEDSEGRR